MTATRQEIIAEARTWIGTRWHHQAALKGVGADCIGLIGGVAHALGISSAWFDERTAGIRCYGRQPDPAKLLAACDELLLPIPVAAATLADILVLRFDKDPQHFALISAVDRIPTAIIHAYAQARRVVENRLDDIWRSRIVCAYRFPGID